MYSRVLISSLDEGIKLVYGPHYDEFTLDALLKTLGAAESLEILTRCDVNRESYYEENKQLFDIAMEDKKNLISNIVSLSTHLLRQYSSRKDVEELAMAIRKHTDIYTRSVKDALADVKGEGKLSEQKEWEQTRAMQLLLNAYHEAIAKMSDTKGKAITEIYEDEFKKGAANRIAENPLLRQTYCPAARILTAKMMLLCEAIEKICGESVRNKIVDACDRQVNKDFAAMMNQGNQ